MEKAKCKIEKTSAGKLIPHFHFDEKHSMSCPQLKHDNLMSLDNQEVEVEREKGQIICIVFQGKEIFNIKHMKKTADDRSRQKRGPRPDQTGPERRRQGADRLEQHRPTPPPQGTDRDQEAIPEETAHAPYNFIPLNEKVVEVSEKDVPGTEQFPLDRYHDDRHTGYIDLHITTKTPIYIRDTLTPDEMKKNEEAKKKYERYINPDYFSPGGIFRIPGSSLRGMLRNIVEIVSFSRFGNYRNDQRDQRLYFRGMADLSPLKKDYMDRIAERKSGILKKSEMHYVIIPTTYSGIDKNESEKMVKHCNKEYCSENYRENEIYKIDNNYLIVPKNPNKKQDWLIEIPSPGSEQHLILDDDIFNYKNDIARSSPNLIEMISKRKEVPCFFITWKDEKNEDHYSFGFTPNFRVAYKKTLGEHIPEELRSADIIDITESMFGNIKDTSGRLFFEDNFLNDNQDDYLTEVHIPKILSNPKPNAFQLYLSQNEKNMEQVPRNLANYNSENYLRGNKLYWHKSTSAKNKKNGETWAWEENNLDFSTDKFNRLLEKCKLYESDIQDAIEIPKKTLTQKRIVWNKLPKEIQKIILANFENFETQHTKIKAIKENIAFSGRIRFENLSDIELGALLFALDLPKGLCHKIGMGKPLGLGSIRIDAELFLSDRKKRYADLLAEWSESIGESSDRKKFKNSFAGFILKKECDCSELWEQPRLKDLKIVLDFENAPDPSQTNYMELEEFKKRLVLPSPQEVMKKKRKSK